MSSSILRKKCMAMSFLILMTLSNFVYAVNEEYIVSFVVGRTSLGLVFVTQTDTAIEAAQASIIPIRKNLGSTAVLAFYDYWGYDVDNGWYEVLVINRDNAEDFLNISRFKFDSRLNMRFDLGTSGQAPGQYHPLHAFRISNDTIGLLTTGTFGTSGANNYVTYSLDGRAKTRIFVNPENHSTGTAAIAWDGGLVSQMTFEGSNHIGVIGKLMNGKLEGSPFEWLNVNDFQGYSQSLSNPIESTGTRYLAYRNFKQPGTSNSKSKVMIQSVDATTGQPQGTPRAITNFARAMNVDAEKFQSIAISPDGGLVLYTAWSNECRKQILFARRLAKGSSVAKPRVVVGCGQLEEYPVGVYGINIARVPVRPTSENLE